ncbi:MAG: hypothetical protein Q7T05_02585, partial [Dehalococcoidia bacterium]|nr:hypothetical protein [Dehalococcoidia bacterium]
MQLRSYQAQIARAVMDSVCDNRGLTFSVEIARQGSKNELSAHLEMLLLTMFAVRGGNLVKASPTFKPQTVISMLRLKERLDDFGFAGLWHSQMGYIIRFGEAGAVFLSAEESANVVGNTAHLLLEMDESQDIAPEKYTRDFKPMGASTNVTTVHYGTTWDDRSLLEQVKQANLEMERSDGIKRHFRYDWKEVARHNPAYRKYVESERRRLGEEHPLFLTQYRLLPIHGGGGFLNAAQLAQLEGDHYRQRHPLPGKTYAAGVDLAGQAEAGDAAGILAARPRNDSTVVTLAEVSTEPNGPLPLQTVRVVEHIAFTGVPHSQAYGAMVDAFRSWRPACIVVDATGIGEPVASFLHETLGRRVVPFKFTQASKSSLGFQLLAAINRGGLKMYRQDGSVDYQQSMWELQRARCQYRESKTINFYVDPSEGHDDYLMSL